MSNKTKIQEFYKDQTIFLTGGTGFVGKLLIEKLLRSCDDLKTIYILIRAKRGKNVRTRFNDIFNYQNFDRLKSEKPNFPDKVRLIEGDCSAPALGLSDQDRAVLISEVTCIIHSAAIVKFDRDIRTAANINVRAVKDILNLAKSIPKLRAFIHVSTLYSHCPQDKIEEKFYDVPISANKLLTILDNLDDQMLNKITPSLLGKWPNTYVFTKAIAEDLIRCEAKHLPIAIVRPGIITSTYREPMPGWLDNVYGPMGIVLGASLGVLRSCNAKHDNPAEMVPADYVANFILAAMSQIKSDFSKNREIPIYNFKTSEKNPITWKQFEETTEEHCWKYPTPKVIWYYSFKLRENTLWHKIYIFFLHTCVGYFVDFILLCLGRQPIAVKSYARLNKLLELISYFALRQWTFGSENTRALWRKLDEQDRATFNFDMEDLDWHKYLDLCVIGGRTYILKEPMDKDNIAAGQRKVNMLRIAYYTFIAIFWYLIYKLISAIYVWIFK